ncbi:MAG TPA: methyltransferase [Propionibacteriaceae bacterium]|nr:methyltransferase [Propionibacteriaceae bacterium]
MAEPDPVARLLLDEAGDLGDVVLVVDDVDGALSSAASAKGAKVLAACDDVRDEAALPAGVTVVDLTGEPDLMTVTTVLWRLPKAVSAVEDVAEVLASRCPPEVVVYGGARDKHLVHAMNDALRASFADVSASRGRQKSRVLRAARSSAPVRTWPRRASLDELGLEVVAYGNVFATTSLDRGTRLLLRALRDTLQRAGGDQGVSSPSARIAGEGPVRALDLGCGSGIVASVLAARGREVLACDTSAAAVASTRLTAEANAVSVGVQRADGIPAGVVDLDLVACNPPFHRGTAKDSSAAFAMIEAAGRALRPGGQLWLVYNSHLPYLPFAREHVGPTRIALRDPSYLVTCSTKL